MPSEKNTPLSMPVKAPHAVNCEEGGKHSPTTFEKKLDGQHIKYRICSKCKKMPPN